MPDVSWLYGDGDVYGVTLPNGHDFPLRVDYTGKENAGVIALIVVSSISLTAVVALLVAIVVSAALTRKAGHNAQLFVRTPVAGYFISLLICDILQAIGSIMNAKWVIERSVRFGDFCQAQGALKQAADVGLAIWSFIIAVHTFNLLFLRILVPRKVMWAALIGGWAAVITFILGGPAVLDVAHNGPFFAISGYWCWISGEYPVPRITVDYMVMFLSAFLCFVIYTLVFLRLRGHIYHDNGRLRLRIRAPARLGVGSREENFGRTIAKKMMMYPAAYTVLILPIAAARFTAWFSRDVPFEWTIFSDATYLLSGVVNVALFFSTRSLLPTRPPPAVSAPMLRASTTDALPPPSDKSTWRDSADLEADAASLRASANVGAWRPESTASNAPLVPARPDSTTSGPLVFTRPESTVSAVSSVPRVPARPSRPELRLDMINLA